MSFGRHREQEAEDLQFQVNIDPPSNQIEFLKQIDPKDQVFEEGTDDVYFVNQPQKDDCLYQVLSARAIAAEKGEINAFKVTSWGQIQCWRHGEGYQNRNTVKFMMRLFLKYNCKANFGQKSLGRAIEAKQVFRDLYQNKQGRINLKIYERLLQKSEFQLANRQVMRQILADKEVLKKELHLNGNIKHKLEYLFVSKVMRLRCLSRNLSGRTESR